jgi:hypothetical protein
MFFRDEWQYLVNRFSLNDRILGRLIPIVCSHFNTYERLAEVRSSFNSLIINLILNYHSRLPCFFYHT